MTSSRTKSKPETLTHTIRPLPYTYMHLSLSQPPHNPPPQQPSSTTTPPPPPLPPTTTLDILTAHTALQSALTRFLGLHGSAISIDILHVSPTKTTTTAKDHQRETGPGPGTEMEMGEFWIRVPREDGDQVVAALSGWVGREGQVLRVKGRGEWLGGLVGGGGKDDVWGKTR